MAHRKHFDGIGKRPTGTRIVSIVFTTGRDDAVTLVVVRSDVHDRLVYRCNDRTPGGVLDIARSQGVPVTDLHAMKDMPKWAQRIFFRAFGWQLNWKFIGWTLLKKPAATSEAAA